MEILEQQSFSSLGLSDSLLQILASQGFEHPTPIQAQAIPPALQGQDILGCAQTGTGKTLAFGLPLLQKLAGQKGPQALILCPTREIALQSQEVLNKFSETLKVESLALIGGRGIVGQAKGIKKNPAILVATPGRLLDHAHRKNLNLKDFRYCVLDEADHMFDLGFLPQVREIVSKLPKSRQTLMFSATFPTEIERLARTFLKNPIKITVAPPGTAAERIDHSLYLVDSSQKRDAIVKLLEEETESTLIFTRTKLDAEWLYRLLEKKGHAVHALHSDRSQSERIATLKKFKEGEYNMLVATDVMARGIDIAGIGHVINYDIPQNPDDYIHRVGRTARAQASGKASTLAIWRDKSYIEAIEKILGSPIPRKTLEGILEHKEVKKAPPAFGRIGKKGARVRLR
ncbi:MAG: DEAD/DEAH box helicase [Deltaproteobacteria bacterium]|nr:DEAD/DEAH box helicase [Deltaproteobacteria bacterium]